MWPRPENPSTAHLKLSRCTSLSLNSFPQYCPLYYWKSSLSKHFAGSALPDYCPKIALRVLLLYKSVIISIYSAVCFLWESHFQPWPLEKCSLEIFCGFNPAMMIQVLLCTAVSYWFDSKQNRQLFNIYSIIYSSSSCLFWEFAAFLQLIEGHDWMIWLIIHNMLNVVNLWCFKWWRLTESLVHHFRMC